MHWRRSLKAAAVLAVAALLLSLSLTLPARAEGNVDMWDTLRTVLDLIRAYHKSDVSMDDLLRGAIKGAIDQLDDPYTEYMDAEQWTRYLNSLDGTVSGIGAFIDKQGSHIVVISPIRGGPAEAAGVKAGDRILAADGVSLLDVSVERAVSIIRGPAGSVVRLLLERPSEGRTFELSITRAVVQIPTLDYEMRDGDVGYIKLYQFTDVADQKFFATVQALQGQGARGLVLDMRENPGGFLATAVKIAGAFVPEGEPVVRTESRGTIEEVLYSPGGRIDLPWVVLVDGSSASGAELLAAAIQDYGAAPLVGVKTFGKGTVQSLLNLEAKGGLKVTIAEYFSPKMRKVDGVGVTPDYVVDSKLPDAESVAPLNYAQQLSRGRVGRDVMDLQRRLAFLGYYKGPESGWFSPMVLSAVVYFQEQNGMRATGVVDKVTVERFNAEVASKVERLKGTDVQLEKALAVLREAMAAADAGPAEAAGAVDAAD